MSLVSVCLPPLEVASNRGTVIHSHARGDVSENAPLCHAIAAYLNAQPRPATSADIASALRVSESTIKRHLSIMDDFCHIERRSLVRGYSYTLTERGAARYIKTKGAKP
jgi:Mn-dependent DtxR family transcriptional regulator